MGVDIHLHYVDNNCFVEDIIDYFRNYEFFENIIGNGDDVRYNYLQRHLDIPDVARGTIIEEDLNDGCYGFSYIKASDYLKWFEKYKPNLNAGFVTKYEKWLYEKCNVYPESLLREIDSESGWSGNYEWIEFQDKSFAYKIYEFLINNNYSDGYIVYYFDC